MFCNGIGQWCSGYTQPCHAGVTFEDDSNMTNKTQTQTQTKRQRQVARQTRPPTSEGENPQGDEGGTSRTATAPAQPRRLSRRARK